MPSSVPVRIIICRNSVGRSVRIPVKAKSITEIWNFEVLFFLYYLLADFGALRAPLPARTPDRWSRTNPNFAQTQTSNKPKVWTNLNFEQTQTSNKPLRFFERNDFRFFRLLFELKRIKITPFNQIWRSRVAKQIFVWFKIFFFQCDRRNYILTVL